MGTKANPKPRKRKLPSKQKPRPHQLSSSKPPHPNHHHHHHHQQQHQTPPIPFHLHDRILLLGEGDLSFAHALRAHHRCRHILATTYDSRAEVLRKYPQAAETIADLGGEGVRVLYGVDATRLGRGREVREGWKGMGIGMRTEDGDGEGIADGGGDAGSGEEGDGDGDGDADGSAEGQRAGGWDKIVFNFPHVGGKTKDVNRQVRYNQELLVSFFKAAMPLLAHSSTPTGKDASAIIVTLFESEPYTLWNIRDLARHVGLKVGRSFKFQASAYPGYRHARTLGNVDGVVSGGAWRGEERAARTYVFEVDRKDQTGEQGSGVRSGGGGRREKRKRGESGDEDDGDD